MQETTIAFLGAGQMARALATGFVQRQLVAPDRIRVYDISTSASRGFVEAVGGGQVVDQPNELPNGATALFLAVKPQHLAAAMDSIRDAEAPHPLIVSIAAGAPLATIEAALPARRVIRVMPNTPCLVGEGAAAFARGAAATDADAELTRRLLSAVGVVHETSEAMLDAVTGLSGSGPAFVYLMIEALADGGVSAGLPRQLAADLATQTVLGAARMVKQTEEHPGVLKDRVASPAGTTIAGLRKLEQGGFRAAVIEAVQAASDRSRELGGS